MVDCSIGDIVILTVDKPKFSPSSTSPDWVVGMSVKVSTVYSDGDIYAKDETGYGRLLKQGEFIMKPYELGDINGEINVHADVSNNLIRQHFENIRLAKEKKEQEEKALRDEYERKYGTRYPTYYQLHPDESSSNYSYQSDGCQIYFYEWSDINGSPRRFYSFTSFKNYIQMSNIKVSENEMSDIHGMYYVYCTCKKGSNEIIYAASDYGLRRAFNELEKDEADNKKYIITKPDKDNDMCNFLIEYKLKEDEGVKSFSFGPLRRNAVIFDNADEADKAINNIRNASLGYVNVEKEEYVDVLML